MNTDLPISSRNNPHPDVSDAEAEGFSRYHVDDRSPCHGDGEEPEAQYDAGPSEEEIQRDEIENGPGSKEFIE